MGALRENTRPSPPLSYGKAKDYFMRVYGRETEGRAQESLGSTLADYIWTEISLRAETCTNPIHYKAIGNNLWYTLGEFVEPPPHDLPGIPFKNGAGTNEVGNVYEALVGLYWLEENYDRLTDLFLTLMDLDQIEHPSWREGQRRTSVGYLRGASAVRCTMHVFVNEGRSYGYSYNGPAPALGSVVIDRPPWLAQPGGTLHIPEWHNTYQGPMPKGEHFAPPTPGEPQGRPERSAAIYSHPPAGAQQAGSSSDPPAQPRGHSGADREPDEEEERREADRRSRIQQPYDLNDGNTTAITFLSGQPEPLPDPTMRTLIFKLTPLGDSVLYRIVPPGQRGRGQERTEAA